VQIKPVALERQVENGEGSHVYKRIQTLPMPRRSLATATVNRKYFVLICRMEYRRMTPAKIG